MISAVWPGSQVCRTSIANTQPAPRLVAASTESPVWARSQTSAPFVKQRRNMSARFAARYCVSDSPKGRNAKRSCATWKSNGASPWYAMRRSNAAARSQARFSRGSRASGRASRRAAAMPAISAVSRESPPNRMRPASTRPIAPAAIDIARPGASRSPSARITSQATRCGSVASGSSPPPSGARLAVHSAGSSTNANGDSR